MASSSWNGNVSCNNPNPLVKVFSPTEENQLELLRALRLSQTRAREAETKWAEIVRDKDMLEAAFAGEAIKVFGYRQLLSTHGF